MKRSIVKIQTPIRNRIQWIDFYTEQNNLLRFPYKDLCDYLQTLYSFAIPITEVEVLLGSFFEPSYYGKGEVRPNKKVTVHSDDVIKAWHLSLSGTKEQIYKNNVGKLLEFQTLAQIDIHTKKNREFARILTTHSNVYFIDVIDLTRVTGLKSEEFYLLTGAFLSPVFYKAGELSRINVVVYEDNKIVKDLNLRFDVSIDSNHEQQIRSHIANPIVYTIPERREEIKFDSTHHKLDSDRYNEWDDEAIINEAFNGDPSATWNID